MPAHVMILGCGRSGTSIFGELFDGLDRYTYRSEPPFHEIALADTTGPTAFKVPQESADYPATPGLSFPIDLYRSIFPGAKIFWIVRHPLDAICSLRVGIDADWRHHPRPPDWRDWLARPLLERCAHHWSYLNTIGFGQVEQVSAVVRFERLVAEPRAFAQEVCDAVGVSGAANAAHLQTWAARVQDTNNAAFIEAQTSRNHSRPDHQKRIGRWRENLSDAEADSIWPLVATAARQFGYSCEDRPFDP